MEQKVGLTPAEQRVLTLARQGLTNAQIASELGVSVDAVRYHLKELHSKLGTESSRPTLNRSRWPLGMLLVVLKKQAAVAGIAAGVGAVGLGGYLAVQMAYQSEAAGEAVGHSKPVYCVAEVLPTPDSSAGLAAVTPAPARCFGTPGEVRDFYASVP